MTPAPARGWVYVLVNPAIPRLVKIGCTERTPEDRARELSNKTAVPVPYRVAWAWPVSDCKVVEAITHERLGHLRPNSNREFFSCSVRQARRAIKRAARAYLRPAWLRLILGPRRRAPGRAVRRFRRPAPAVGLLPVLLAGVVVALLATAKPVVPLWFPASIRATVLLAERL